MSFGDLNMQKTEDKQWEAPTWAKWEVTRTDAEEHKKCPSRRGSELVMHNRPMYLGDVSSKPHDNFLRLDD